MQGPQQSAPPSPTGAPGGSFQQFWNDRSAAAQEKAAQAAYGAPPSFPPGWRPPGVEAWSPKAPRAPWDPGNPGMSPYGPLWKYGSRGLMARERSDKTAKDPARPGRSAAAQIAYPASFGSVVQRQRSEEDKDRGIC